MAKSRLGTEAFLIEMDLEEEIMSSGSDSDFPLTGRRSSAQLGMLPDSSGEEMDGFESGHDAPFDGTLEGESWLVPLIIRGLTTR